MVITGRRSSQKKTEQYEFQIRQGDIFLPRS